VNRAARRRRSRLQGRISRNRGRTGADGPPQGSSGQGGIKGGDKLAVIGWEKEEEGVLPLADPGGGTQARCVKGVLRPMMGTVLKGRAWWSAKRQWIRSGG